MCVCELNSFWLHWVFVVVLVLVWLWHVNLCTVLVKVTDLAEAAECGGMSRILVPAQEVNLGSLDENRI